MTLDAVRFDDVWKRFRGGGDTDALAGFSCAVPEGSVTALLGKNGAGKTTALKCAMGLLQKDGGEIEVLGVPADRTDDATRRSIGYVSERLGLDQRLTLAELVRFTRAFYPDWDDGLAADLTDRLGLTDTTHLSRLSLGQSRKVGLLLNLAFRPRLLLLDEPAANLDAVVRREFLEVVLELFRREGLTVVLSTHLLGDVERVADRVVLIEDGRLRIESDLDDLKDRVKCLRLAPRNGLAIDESVEIPGVLTRRRLGEELLLTVDGFGPQLREHLRTALPNVDFDVIDLPLEEIFIAFGSDRGDR